MRPRPGVRRLFPVVTNYRGRSVGVWLGVAMTAALLVWAGFAVAVSYLSRSTLTGDRRRLLWMLAGIAAVCLVGLYDDRRQERARGIVRQLGLLMRGRMPSAAAKLVVIVLAAAVVEWSAGARGAALALAIPVVAGAANTWNLLDVVPGRSLKYFLPAVAILGLIADDPAYRVLALNAFGVGAGALAFDLRERAMLGDAGSNVLGFVIGLGLAEVLSGAGLAVALAVVLVIHLASETVTLSRVIRGVAPLRWFDDLGRVRLPPEPAAGRVADRRGSNGPSVPMHGRPTAGA